MDPQSDVHVSENGELGGLSEVRNGNVSGRIEAFNGLAEGNNLSDVLQSKRGHYVDIPASKISELMKLGNLENTSTHALFSAVNKILDESIERKHEDIPQQSNLYKSREDRYHSKIRALETLATGTSEENEVVMNQLQQMKVEKTKIEEKKKLEEQDLIKLRKEMDSCESQILSLNEELTLAKKSYKENLFQLEAKAEETKEKLQKKILELECLLTDSSKKVKELEDFSESKFLRWKRKEHGYRHFIDSQFGSLQELRLTSESIKQEVSKMKNTYAEEFYHFGINLKGLIDAAQNYHSVLEENRKLYNEVQDLKEEVFRDTQPLIRSVLDGYNVCIFAYGQTGSGKLTQCLHPVKSTTDVLELMNVGLMNRAVGATALNERSSRSHSERVDRSEATGDRLREAQHINKSLSALGDVIFALAQKSSHVPYRNSKLTQVLQSSLGGQAKTLMFVQLNPDVESYSETISTLKFAERVSGVELGAARSNKEGRGVRELMEQVSALKDAVAKKDEEIGRLRSVKTNGNSERRGMSSPNYGSGSPRRHSLGATRPSQRLSGGKSSSEKAASDLDNSSSTAISNLRLLDLADDGGKNPNDDVELLGFGDADSDERLSDISDGVLSMGTETDGSINSIVEYTLFPETAKPSAEITEKPNVPVKLPRPPKQSQAGSSRSSLSKSSTKIPSSKKATTSSSSALKPPKRWQ
ncbi:hypothetical protein DH2020_028731 [Rehmannia glutinosa]|uniref:Kinesin motor domain-containing protein n=1 Tax=Rehmannia glutinosa TaxID=99300 RepID=A0ABR0VQJ6_REHGL